MRRSAWPRSSSQLRAYALRKLKSRSYHGPMGAVIQSATYKLNNVCNAGSLPRGRLWGLSSGMDVHNDQSQLEYTTRCVSSQDIFSISCASKCRIHEEREKNCVSCRNKARVRLFIGCTVSMRYAALHLERPIAWPGGHTGAGDSMHSACLRRKGRTAAA